MCKYICFFIGRDYIGLKQQSEKAAATVEIPMVTADTKNVQKTLRIGTQLAHILGCLPGDRIIGRSAGIG